MCSTTLLHTDEPHPHVHLVVKATSEQGARLNIRKATLREWRREFARQLRAEGIAANATERAVRGETRTYKKDAIYRAAERGASTHMLTRAQEVASDLAKGRTYLESGITKLNATRRAVERGWNAVSDHLLEASNAELAAQVARFAKEMPRVQTEKQRLASKIVGGLRRKRLREVPTR